ncbi:hypothetical protein SAMN04487981_12078 [Streptomyces sp. cf386]|nr:hypothetical protein SAMN04487981_12078 [Streptomyces sp. cf386]
MIGELLPDSVVAVENYGNHAPVAVRYPQGEAFLGRAAGKRRTGISRRSALAPAAPWTGSACRRSPFYPVNVALHDGRPA